MTAFLISLALFLAPTWSARPGPHAPATTASRVDEVRYTSAALGAKARYTVYLPPGYAADTATRYPVVVLLHGLGGESQDWFDPALGDLRRILDRMIGEHQLQPVIAVAPDGLDGYWTDHVSHARGTAWGTFIGEVIDDLGKRYRASDHRAIVGVSMGGHGAMSHGLMNPDRFRAIVSMSGALFQEPPTHRKVYKRVWGDPADVPYFDRTAPIPLLRAWPSDRPPPPIWLFCGKADVDRFLDWTLAADTLLTERHFVHALELSDGPHGWNTWRPMGPAWLLWLGPLLR